MERNSTIAAWRLPGGITSAADKGVSAMILSYHDSVPPTFADKQVNAHRAYNALAISVVSCSPDASMHLVFHRSKTLISTDNSVNASWADLPYTWDEQGKMKN